MMGRPIDRIANVLLKIMQRVADEEAARGGSMGGVEEPLPAPPAPRRARPRRSPRREAPEQARALPPPREDLIERLEAELRARIDAGDTAAAAEIQRAIDRKRPRAAS